MWKMLLFGFCFVLNFIMKPIDVLFFFYSSSSLFTVSSPNQLFVHVQSPRKGHVNPVAFCINYLLKNSINTDTST